MKKNLYTVKYKKQTSKQSFKVLSDLGLKHAKELTLKSTYAEKVMKIKLKEAGLEFEFQKPFNDSKRLYIVDFFFPTYGVILEVDGGYHFTKEQRKRDKDRDDWFKRRGYHVWRMSNDYALVVTISSLTTYLSENRGSKIKQSSKKRRKAVTN